MDCTNCIHCGKEGKCAKGPTAELYCMGGGYELWAGNADFKESEDDTFIREDGEDKEVSDSMENSEVFDDPENFYPKVNGSNAGKVILDQLLNMVPADIEKQVGRSLTVEELELFKIAKKNAFEIKMKTDMGEIQEKELDGLLNPQQQQKVAAFKEAVADIESRPKESSEGFNGKKIESSGEIKSRTCEGCKNISMVGCFLGRYYDCVDHGRYLFDGKDQALGQITSIEREEEIKDDLKDIDFVDGILNERRRKEN